jgi:hypothetical protein
MFMQLFYEKQLLSLLQIIVRKCSLLLFFIEIVMIFLEIV